MEEAARQGRGGVKVAKSSDKKNRQSTSETARFPSFTKQPLLTAVVLSRNKLYVQVVRFFQLKFTNVSNLCSWDILRLVNEQIIFPFVRFDFTPPYLMGCFPKLNKDGKLCIKKLHQFFTYLRYLSI